MSGSTDDTDWGALEKNSMPGNAPPAPPPQQVAPAQQDDTDWSSLEAQQPPAPPVDHPTAGPSGNTLVDAGRRLFSAGVNAVGGIGSSVFGAVTPDTLNQSDALVSNAVKNQGVATPEPAPVDPDALSAANFKDKAFTAAGVPEYIPQTEAGRIAQGALTAGVAGLANPSSLPSLLGAGAGAQSFADLFPDHPVVAGTIGALLGGSAGNAAANLPLTPAAGALPTEDAQLANVALQNGIPLKQSQVGTSRLAKFADSMGNLIPFSGNEAFSEAQQTALNRAISHTFGEDAPRITPEVLQSARARIGGVFNDVAARTPIDVNATYTANGSTGALLDHLANIETNAPQVLTDAEWRPIRNQLDNVLGKVQPGDTISGEAYQALTRKGTPLDVAQNSGSPNVRQYAGQIRNVLDGALQASAAPEDIEALQGARAQWKAMKTVEPLTLRADTPGGVTPSTGDISPAALRGAVNQSYRNAATASTGQIPLNDLAKVGQRFLKEPNSSGTGERHMIEKGVGTLAAGVEAIHAGAPIVPTVLAPVAAIGAARAAGALNRFQPLVRRSVAASLNPSGFQFQSPNFTPLVPEFAPPIGLAAPNTQAAQPMGLAPSQNQ